LCQRLPQRHFATGQIAVLLDAQQYMGGPATVGNKSWTTDGNFFGIAEY